MKVLLINGSPRQKGNTAIALAEIAKTLAEDGIDSETVWIGNKPIRGCTACNQCGNKPGACVFNDDCCNGISAKYASADALIIGTNLGGLGTMIASMASLISYKLITKGGNVSKGRYLLYFTGANVAFLICLIALHLVIA